MFKLSISSLAVSRLRACTAALMMGAACVSAHSESTRDMQVRTARSIPSAETAAKRLVTPALGGNARDGLKVAIQKCQACHGIDGNSANFKDYPKLSAQLQGYLYLQLVNFATGERRHPVMSPMVAGLTNTDFLNLSAHYSQQKRLAEPPLPAERTAIGNRYR